MLIHDLLRKSVSRFGMHVAYSSFL